MHSSGMRNVRSLTVSHSIRFGEEGLPNTPPDADPSWMQIPLRRRPSSQQTLLDADAKLGRPPWMQTPLRQTPLWTEGMIHACENITFPQLLLRAVININLNLNTLLVS